MVKRFLIPLAAFLLDEGECSFRLALSRVEARVKMRAKPASHSVSIACQVADAKLWNGFAAE